MPFFRNFLTRKLTTSPISFRLETSTGRAAWLGFGSLGRLTIKRLVRHFLIYLIKVDIAVWGKTVPAARFVWYLGRIGLVLICPPDKHVIY